MYPGTSDLVSGHLRPCIRAPAALYPATCGLVSGHLRPCIRPPPTLYPATSDLVSGHLRPCIRPPAALYPATSDLVSGHLRPCIRPPPTLYPATYHLVSGHLHACSWPPTTPKSTKTGWVSAFFTNSGPYCNLRAGFPPWRAAGLRLSRNPKFKVVRTPGFPRKGAKAQSFWIKCPLPCGEAQAVGVERRRFGVEGPGGCGGRGGCGGYRAGLPRRYS